MRLAPGRRSFDACAIGAYTGDVTALSLLNNSQGTQPWRCTLIGIGGRLLAYNATDGRCLKVLHVFRSHRIQGITSIQLHDSWLVAVHGSRTAQVWQFELSRPEAQLVAQPHCTLTRFQHWIMATALVSACPSMLAVGLSDNSVELWRLPVLHGNMPLSPPSSPQRIARIECSERCLLYSMALLAHLDAHGNAKVWAAAGTIFNEVLVWSMPGAMPASTQCPDGSPGTVQRQQELEQRFSGISDALDRLEQQAGMSPLQLLAARQHALLARVARLERVVCGAAGGQVGSSPRDTFLQVPATYRLQGHQGSIHRVSWGPGAAMLASASDDRTVRLWHLPNPGCAPAGGGAVIQSQLTLWGHSGRVWDCAVADGLLVSASEDCTCRIWDASSGQQLAVLQGHQGRGVWRCMLAGDLVFTGGADASVKLWRLQDWLPRPPSLNQASLESSRLPASTTTSASGKEDRSGCATVKRYALDLQHLAQPGAGASSGRDWVRCMALPTTTTLYLATNQGFLHQVQLPSYECTQEGWSVLWHSSRNQPITCMAAQHNATEHVDHVAVGQMTGHVGVFRVPQVPGDTPAQVWAWDAYGGRPCLSLFWCRSLAASVLLTTSVDSAVCWWSLSEAGRQQQGGGTAGMQRPPTAAPQGPAPALLAAFPCPSRGRVVAVDACPVQRLLLLGDQEGNVAAHVLPQEVLEGEAQGTITSSPIAYFPHQHGSCAVSLLQISGHGIVSAGRDGILCSYTTWSGGLRCSGTQKLPGITGVELDASLLSEGAAKRVLAGFHATDFVVWSEYDQCELMRVSCGGWRRPSAFALGSTPHDMVFAFYREGEVCVAQHLASSQESTAPAGRDDGKATPRSLHHVFHGREVHAVRLLSLPQPGGPLALVTASEDGSVRCLTWDPAHPGSFTSCSALGEHAGGTTVRCVDAQPLGGGSTGSWLVVSGGAKEVVMAWLLQWQPGAGAASHRWLSTRAPPRRGLRPSSNASGHNSLESDRRYLALALLRVGAAAAPSAPHTLPAVQQAAEKVAMHPHCAVGCVDSADPCKPASVLKADADTGQSCEVTLGTTPACQETAGIHDGGRDALAAAMPGAAYMLAASSDASLQLLSLDLVSLTWSCTALLQYHRSPVLALAHVLLPGMLQAQASPELPHTGACESLSQPSSGPPCVAPAVPSHGVPGTVPSPQAVLAPSFMALGQPATSCRQHGEYGKGSHAEGRDRLLAFSGATDGCVAMWELSGVVLGPQYAGPEHGQHSNAQVQAPSSEPGVSNAQDAGLIYPVCESLKLHMSGVNAMDAAVVCPGVVLLATGGDDQALTVTLLKTVDAGACAIAPQVLCSCTEANAHSSAIRGLAIMLPSTTASRYDLAAHMINHMPATNAGLVASVFTTGLDQQVRCWTVTCCGTAVAGLELVLREECSSPVEVMEPAALDVLPVVTSGDTVLVAVAGRGAQLLPLSKSLMGL